MGMNSDPKSLSADPKPQKNPSRNQKPGHNKSGRKRNQAQMLELQKNFIELRLKCWRPAEIREKLSLSLDEYYTLNGKLHEQIAERYSGSVEERINEEIEGMKRGLRMAEERRDFDEARKWKELIAKFKTEWGITPKVPEKIEHSGTIDIGLDKARKLLRGDKVEP